MHYSRVPIVGSCAGERVCCSLSLSKAFLLLKKESNLDQNENECRIGLREGYKRLWKIINNGPVQKMCFILLNLEVKTTYTDWFYSIFFPNWKVFFRNSWSPSKIHVFQSVVACKTLYSAMVFPIVSFIVTLSSLGGKNHFVVTLKLSAGTLIRVSSTFSHWSWFR